MKKLIQSTSSFRVHLPVGGMLIGNTMRGKRHGQCIRGLDLRKIIDYQTEHDRILEEAATTLQFALPRDIMMTNVLPFLTLPAHTFEVEEDQT